MGHRYGWTGDPDSHYDSRDEAEADERAAWESERAEGDPWADFD